MRTFYKKNNHFCKHGESDHRQVSVHVMLKIDRAMVPVVGWLNSYLYVSTLSHCEGFFLDEMPPYRRTDRRPYISFATTMKDNRETILRTVFGYADVDFYEGRQEVTTLRFRSKQRMLDFIREKIPEFVGKKRQKTAV